MSSFIDVKKQSGASAGPVDRFIEQMGLVAQLENLPRIAGRLFGLFVVEGGPLNIREIADRLRVSRASISTNARVLAQLGLLERAAVAGDRQDYYQLAPDPYRNLVTGLVQKMALAHQIVAKAAEEFPAERKTAKQRVAELAAYYQIATEMIAEVGERCGQRWGAGNTAASDLPDDDHLIKSGGD